MDVNEKPLLKGAKKLFRIHLRPADTAELKADDFCFEKGIVGFGWPIEGQSAFSNHQAYRAAAYAQYVADLPKKDRNGGYKRAMNALLKIQGNDLIWSRTRDGRYYLGRVYGPWIYNVSGDHLKADICNYKQCEWIEIGTVGEVIGAVTNRFIGRATLTQVHSYPALDFSVHCWNTSTQNKSRLPFPKWNKRPSSLLEMISPEDCEDIVGIYLQHVCNYVIIPSTNKRDTPAYEFELLPREKNARPAVVQVKQSSNPAAISEAACRKLSRTHHVFLFQTALPDRLPFTLDNVTWISRETIEVFMWAHKHLLPGRVSKWMELAEQMGNRPTD